MVLQFKIEQLFTSAQSPIKLSPHIYNADISIIRNTEQQQVLFNHSQSPKRAELALHINVSTIKPDCSALLGAARTGWLAWLHGQLLKQS